MKKRITDEDTVFDLDEALDDIHSIVVCFVKQGKQWFAKTQTDHGAYTSHVWWALTDEPVQYGHLDTLIVDARKIGRAA